MRNVRFSIIILLIVLFMSGTVFAQNLSTDLWIEGNLTDSGSEGWYTFNVYEGITYYVWVFDSRTGGATDREATVRLDARYGSRTGTPIFQNSAGGFGTRTLVAGSQDTMFRANQTGTVHVRVFPDQAANRFGEYLVAFTTTNGRPSINPPRVTPATTATKIDFGPWVDGSIHNRSGEDWYSFNVDSGVSYHIFVKDRFSRGITRDDGYAEILIDARYANRSGAVIFQDFEEANREDPATFTANQRGTVFVRVFPFPDTNNFGRYRIVVTTVSRRPAD